MNFTTHVFKLIKQLNFGPSNKPNKNRQQEVDLPRRYRQPNPLSPTHRTACHGTRPALGHSKIPAILDRPAKAKGLLACRCIRQPITPVNLHLAAPLVLSGYH
jgi:hypothetical protein